MLTLNELANDPMVIFKFTESSNKLFISRSSYFHQVPFHFHDTELMDTGMSSDSDCNSYSGLLEFNLHASALDDRDYSKFDPTDFPNLLSEVGKFNSNKILNY